MEKNSTKKKQSSSKEKKPSSKSSSKTKSTKKRSSSASRAEKPIETISNLVASKDFEAGIIFSRYDKNKSGNLTPDEFRKLWTETIHPNNATLGVNSNASGKSTLANLDEKSFEAGQIFSKFDIDNDGKLTKQDFEKLVREFPELLNVKSSLPSSYSLLPTEVITNRLLTHYDETAGVALPRAAVDNHRAMGNTVAPLIESYRARYDRLRALVTGRLLPRREHLLQVRRQLNNSSAEVEASRKAIERETVTDMEQILERLRTAESMRQSAIKHQVMQVDEELHTIERIVRRVEQANEENSEAFHSGNGYTGILVTSAGGAVNPIELVKEPQAALMVELIQQFADISSQIERISSKSITIQTDFPTDDFPKETSERLEVISRCDRYAHALSVKDHMLWLAIQEKDNTIELLDEERRLSQEYAQEVAKWAELSQSLSQKVMTLEEDNLLLESTNQDLINILREHNIFYVKS